MRGLRDSLLTRLFVPPESASLIATYDGTLSAYGFSDRRHRQEEMARVIGQLQESVGQIESVERLHSH